MNGILKFDEPLAPYTSWHIGGPADKYYRTLGTEDLARFLKTLETDEPVTFLGLGSNVLIHDSGIRGAVIHTLAATGTKNIVEIESNKNKKIIRVEAGVTCSKLAKYSAKEGLLGGEFFAGIPGTIGGALAMNAGAWGGETWGVVNQVEVINRFGEIKNYSRSDYKTSYRTVQKIAEQKEEWFVAGFFEFEKGDPTIAAQKVKSLLQERTAKQPIGVFSCGSVFKNPINDHAGRLIEASNLKGYRIGGAEVSSKHANFILNLGNATAQDVLQLIKHLQAVVLKDHHVRLEPEVRMLGF